MSTEAYMDLGIPYYMVVCSPYTRGTKKNMTTNLKILPPNIVYGNILVRAVGPVAY